MVESSGLTKSPFTLSKSSDGVTFITADLAASTSFEPIWTYAVPLGMAVQITPANYIFGHYISGADGTTKITAGMTRLVKMNANGSDTKEVWSGSNAIFLDIGDINKRPNLKVPVVVNASQKLQVQVKGLGAALDFEVSDFYIECVQFYERIN